MVNAALNQQGVAWMLAAQAGDSNAFHRLYTAYYPHVFRFCARMLGDRHRGEEAAQEAFVDLYRALKNYRAHGSFQSFMFTLAANRCRKELRKTRDFSLPENWDVADEQATPEAAAIERELAAALNRAFAALPEKQRLALAMVQEQGLTYEEAASALAASVGAVKTWIFRARTALKTIVEAEE